MKCFLKKTSEKESGGEVPEFENGRLGKEVLSIKGFYSKGN